MFQPAFHSEASVKIQRVLADGDDHASLKVLVPASHISLLVQMKVCTYTLKPAYWLYVIYENEHCYLEQAANVSFATPWGPRFDALESLSRLVQSPEFSKKIAAPFVQQLHELGMLE